MIERGFLIALTALSAGLWGCAADLKAERWRDTFEAPTESWLTLGSHRLNAGRELLVRADGVTYREARYELVIEALDPTPAAPSGDTAGLTGGQRYRIVSIDCSPDWAACSMMKTNTELYLTPLGVTRTPLVAGERGRTFDGVYISFAGGTMRPQGPFERLSD